MELQKNRNNRLIGALAATRLPHCVQPHLQERWCAAVRDRCAGNNSKESDLRRLMCGSGLSGHRLHTTSGIINHPKITQSRCPGWREKRETQYSKVNQRSSGCDRAGTRARAHTLHMLPPGLNQGLLAGLMLNFSFQLDKTVTCCVVD